MTSVQIKLTTLEYQDQNFGWYEVYGDQTNLALSSVVASAAFNEISFANAFIHANLTIGDTWYYWVRAAYLDRDTGVITYGTLVALGSITITGTAGGYTDEDAQDAIGTILVGLSYNDATPTIAVKRVVQIQLSDPAGAALTTGDGKGFFRVNAELNGYNLSAVAAALAGAVSTSGTPTFQIANVTDAVDILSTKLTVDANETDSSTAATPAVIDATKDDVATGDMLRIDCDVAGTGAKGLIVELTFSLP